MLMPLLAKMRAPPLTLIYAIDIFACCRHGDTRHAAFAAATPLPDDAAILFHAFDCYERGVTPDITRHYAAAAPYADVYAAPSASHAACRRFATLFAAFAAAMRATIFVFCRHDYATIAVFAPPRFAS